MSREVVEDDVNLLLARAQGYDFFEKGEELAAGVTGGGFAVYATGGGIQRRIQGQGSMPVVLEAVTLGASGGKRQDRVEAIQGLNSRLLVNAEHGGMLRWTQIESDDVGRLGFELRIVAGHVAFQSVRLQSRLSPDAMYGVFADAQRRGQFAATPVSGAVAWLLAGGRQNPGRRAGVSTLAVWPGW